MKSAKQEPLQSALEEIYRLYNERTGAEPGPRREFARQLLLFAEGIERGC